MRGVRGELGAGVDVFLVMGVGSLCLLFWHFAGLVVSLLRYYFVRLCCFAIVDRRSVRFCFCVYHLYMGDYEGTLLCRFFRRFYVLRVFDDDFHEYVGLSMSPVPIKFPGVVLRGRAGPPVFS